MLSEPKGWQAARRQQMAMRYPELAVSDAEGLLRVDGERIARGELPTTFSQAAMRLANRASQVKLVK